MNPALSRNCIRSYASVVRYSSHNVFSWKGKLYTGFGVSFFLQRFYLQYHDDFCAEMSGFSEGSKGKKIQEKPLKITGLKIFFALGIILASADCTQSKTDNSKSTTSALAGLVGGVSSEQAKDFVLNGSWNSFIGSSTTAIGTININAKSNSGVEVDDGTGFSACYLIAEFSNTSVPGYYVSQNPSSNGACFSPDTNKGKYNYNVFVKDSSKANTYWVCTIGFGKSSVTEAKASSLTNLSTVNLTTTGCNGSSWTRMEKK